MGIGRSANMRALNASPGFLANRRKPDYTPERAAKISASLRRTLATPEGKAMRSKAMLEVQSRPEVREKVVRKMRATMATPEFQAARSKTMLEVHARPEVKSKHRASTTAANRKRAGWLLPVNS